MPLPPREEIEPIAELYLLYCDSQPLPLFHRGSFVASLWTRESEVIFAILALASRFSYAHHSSSDLDGLVDGYAEVARGLVMKRVSEGPVELSTLQCLCLLSLVDFTSMHSASYWTDRMLTSFPRWPHTSLQRSQQPRNESRKVCQSWPRASFVNEQSCPRRTQALLLEHMSSQTITWRRLFYLGYT